MQRGTRRAGAQPGRHIHTQERHSDGRAAAWERAAWRRYMHALIRGRRLSVLSSASSSLSSRPSCTCAVCAPASTARAHPPTKSNPHPHPPAHSNDRLDRSGAGSIDRWVLGQPNRIVCCLRTRPWMMLARRRHSKPDDCLPTHTTSHQPNPTQTVNIHTPSHAQAAFGRSRPRKCSSYEHRHAAPRPPGPFCVCV